MWECMCTNWQVQFSDSLAFAKTGCSLKVEKNVHQNSLISVGLAESLRKWICCCQLVSKELLIIFMKVSNIVFPLIGVAKAFACEFHFIWSCSVILIWYFCKLCARNLQNKTTVQIWQNKLWFSIITEGLELYWGLYYFSKYEFLCRGVFFFFCRKLDTLKVYISISIDVTCLQTVYNWIKEAMKEETK